MYIPICCHSHLQLIKDVLVLDFRRREVEARQTERVTDRVTGVRVEEHGHAARAEVAVTVTLAVGRVYLRVGPQVAHALDINHDQLVRRPLKREVAERLKQGTTRLSKPGPF